MSGSLSEAYFDALYAADPDPWGFATSAYEAAKYAATLAALERPRYAAALEVGCSIGVLTRLLAPRCGALLGLDPAEAALAQARRRNADMPHVRFQRGAIPRNWPPGSFDLILLSEVLYYLDPADLEAAAQRVIASAATDATVLLVHWLGPTNYPQSGDAAVQQFLSASSPRFSPRRQVRTDTYRLDLLQHA